MYRQLIEQKRQFWQQVKDEQKPFDYAPIKTPERAISTRAIVTSKRGAHWSASCYPAHANYQWHLDRMVEAGMGWVKFLSDGNASPGQGDSGLQFAIDVMKRGMVPVVRFYMPVDHAWTDANENAVKAYVAAGVRYIETINEPDLSYEWSDGHLPDDWAERSFRNWIFMATRIIALGGIPLSPSLASGFMQNRGDGAGQLQINPFEMVRDAGIKDSEFICSTHNYPLNHVIDYPYDAVNQLGESLTQSEYDRVGGAYAWDGQNVEQINAWRESDKNPDDDIYDDDSCFNAYEIFIDLLDEAGFTNTKLLTTEGGPCLTDRHDRRYPRVTPVFMQDMVQDELAVLADEPRFMAYCWWLWGNPDVGGTGGWGTNQWFWPGGPFSDATQFIPIVRWLRENPVINDGNTEPPDPPTPEPQPEPELTWLIPDWNDATLDTAMGAEGETIWRLTRAEIAPDNMANTVWVYAIDKDGKAANVPVTVANINGAVETLPYKPGEPYNRPMWKNDRLTVRIGQDSSDTVFNIHGAYWDVPDVNAYHVGYIFTFQEWVVPGDEVPEPPPEPTEPLGEFLRRMAWDRLYPEGVNRNPAAAFQRVAFERVLGAPRTNEFRVTYAGTVYAVQGFDAILWTEDGNWNDIREIEWNAI